MSSSSTPAPDPPRSIRVAVVLSGYGVVRRGAEAMLEDLLPPLSQRFEISVFSRSGQGPGGVKRGAVRRQDWEEVYSALRPVRKVLDTLFLDPLHVEWTSHLLASLPALLRGGFDVVWHETGRWGGLLLGALRGRAGYRLLDVAHSHALGWEVPFARCRPDLFVSQTEVLAEEIRSRVPGVPVEVVPQGVDLVQFRPGVEPLPLALDGPVVLQAGALTADKRPQLVVEAVARTPYALALAGDGPLAAEVDRLGAERLGRRRYRRISVERAGMPRLYAASRAVALASPLEATGRTLLEAMACGRPVVTLDDAVRREVVGEAGVLVPESGRVEAWTRALRHAVEADFGEAPRRRAEARSLEGSVEAFAGLLTRLAGERR